MKPLKQNLQNIVLAAMICLPPGGYALAADRDAGGDAGMPPPFAHGGPGAHGADDSGCGAEDQGGPGMAPHGREGMRGGPEGMHGGPGMPPFGPPGMAGGRPPFLHGLELTEAQDDKVFAILHAQEPYVREQGKAAAKAEEALRAMADSAQYDDAKAAALAQAAAQAAANLALQRVRTEQKLLALLTPEQRKQLAEDKPHHPQHS